jgi:rod shape-determining protein MreB
VDEPSIIAINRTTKEVLAVGSEAQKMHGKTHEEIKTIRPLKDGVIADFEAAEQMISHFIKLINTKSYMHSEWYHTGRKKSSKRKCRTLWR